MLKIKKLSPDAQLPTKAFPTDAGFDLYADDYAVLEPFVPVAIPTGISIAIPDGFYGRVAEHSSLGVRGIACRAGVIDSGFRGHLKVVLQNLTRLAYPIDKGDRIAQLIITPIGNVGIEETENLPPSPRNGGFGSTGR